ncbi:Hypothetical protein CAP_1497 [Chondromyces apiculatus DSM 436]|uniref:Uncharacterized protein n=1 Tax=Chondromyces apiculatus DSM 436 TaxID=1192034 RepID=A0A017TD98_9BACT|nr:Hypothetical protein CAP_1497 [Chondromyces apiculatus DSM 436]
MRAGHEGPLESERARGWRETERGGASGRGQASRAPRKRSRRELPGTDAAGRTQERRRDTLLERVHKSRRLARKPRSPSLLRSASPCSTWPPSPRS